MNTRNEKARAGILQALCELKGPAGAERIARYLPALGVHLQSRSVRLYLADLDRDGLTSLISRRKGRVITARGMLELERRNVLGKVGFVRGRVDTLGYRMDFNPVSGEGSVIANFAMVRAKDLSNVLSEMKPVFSKNLSMGTRACLIREKQSLAGRFIPTGQIAIGTLCSVTLNGILMSAGIPVSSRYGGLLEMKKGSPVRFVELMEYSGVTIDPLEVFVRANMTDVRGSVRSGDGVITASFREIPSVAMEDARRLFKRLQAAGMGGVLLIGTPGRTLLDIPVSPGRTGLVVVGGLNPLAAVIEAGIPCELKSLCGLEPFSRFEHTEDIF